MNIKNYISLSRFSGSIGGLLLITLTVFPVFVFLLKIPLLRFPDSPLWFPVLCSTLLQAGLSAVFSVLLGIFGALGLCCVFPKCIKKGVVEIFCLLPALLPPLVSVLAWVNVSEVFFPFPFSFSSVLLVHVLMNVGLVSVFFFRLFQTQTGYLPDWAFLHGLSRWRFLKVILFFEFKKDVILIFLLIFSFCFTSFSVPLLVGGVSGQTLEVFIAEKLKDPFTWPEAMALFFIETVFIFIFFSLLYGRKEKYTSQKNRQKRLYLLPCWPFIILPVLPSLLVFFGLGDFFSSEEVWRDFFLIKGSIFTAWVQTVLVGIGTGLCVLLLLLSVAYCVRDLFLRRFLIAYSGSSAAFFGFAFLIMGPDGPLAVLLKWSLGLALLFLPALYRLMGESVLRRLKNQVQLVDLMGVNKRTGFMKIVGPQCIPSFLFLSGVGAFWACGDFAYSSIVAGGQMHLALLIQDLFASYRFELATILTWILIFSGFFCFSLFAGAAFVLHKKSYLSPR